MCVCVLSPDVQYFGGQYGHLERGSLAPRRATSDAPVLLTTTVATFVLAFWTQITLHPGWGKHAEGEAEGEGRGDGQGSRQGGGLKGQGATDA